MMSIAFICYTEPLSLHMGTWGAVAFQLVYLIKISGSSKDTIIHLGKNNEQHRIGKIYDRQGTHLEGNSKR